MDTRLLKEIEVYQNTKGAGKLIVLIGRKGAGKDIAIANMSVSNIKFAEALKSMLRALYTHMDFSFSETDEMLEGHLKETVQDALLGKSSRYLMQTLGTEWGRCLIDPNVWLMAFLKGFSRSRRYNKSDTNYVVTDCRFPNEYGLLAHMDATFIRISRPSLASTDEHISETALDGFPVDHEIINDGTIEELQDKVEAIING